MNCMKREYIEDYTYTIIKDTYKNISSIFPINLIDILEHNNIHLIEGSFNDIDICGAYNRRLNSICISNIETFEMKSFSIAIALYYVFIQKEKDEILLKRNSIFSPTNLIEEESYNFALSLLIPKQSLFNILKLDVDVYTISKIFGVNVINTKNRLLNLEEEIISGLRYDYF